MGLPMICMYVAYESRGSVTESDVSNESGSGFSWIESSMQLRKSKRHQTKNFVLSDIENIQNDNNQNSLLRYTIPIPLEYERNYISFNSLEQRQVQSNYLLLSSMIYLIPGGSFKATSVPGERGEVEEEIIRLFLLLRRGE